MPHGGAAVNPAPYAALYVVSAGRLRLHGFPGWVSWLFIHIAFLTGYPNRFGVVLTWWVAFTRDRRRERAFTTAVVGRAEDVYAAGTQNGAGFGCGQGALTQRGGKCDEPQPA